jgi:SAM-dependent methyltransferase
MCHSLTQIMRLQRALELLALPPDGTPRLLLDIGCGSGLSGEALTEAGHNWLGLDISAAMLDVAVEREVRRGTWLEQTEHWVSRLTKVGHNWLGLYISAAMLDVAVQRQVSRAGEWRAR